MQLSCLAREIEESMTLWVKHMMLNPVSLNWFCFLFSGHRQVLMWCRILQLWESWSVNSCWVQMRTVPMCFSILEVPKGRINSLANFCRESFHCFSRRYGHSPSFKLLCSKTYGLEDQDSYTERWSRRRITTGTEGSKKTIQSHKLKNIKFEATSTTINVNKTEISKIQRIQHYDIEQIIAENKDLAKLVTAIVFDIETTGFSRENERIIEIALQDLLGGENSTFQTLVNPKRQVPNAHVHGITTDMVCKPDVPRYSFPLVC